MDCCRLPNKENQKIIKKGQQNKSCIGILKYALSCSVEGLKVLLNHCYRSN